MRMFRDLFPHRWLCTVELEDLNEFKYKEHKHTSNHFFHSFTVFFFSEKSYLFQIFGWYLLCHPELDQNRVIARIPQTSFLCCSEQFRLNR